jgi:hypothetical protein
MRVRSILTGLAAGVALAASAVPASAAPDGAVRPLGAPGPLGDEQLSDEERLTRWAHVYRRARVRSEPSAGARTITRLRFRTEDGPPEVYPVLRSRVAGGVTWLQVRLPMRPNGRKGWVPRSALGPLRVADTKLRVNRTTLRATLYKDGRRIWSSRIGVGKRATPTPAGRFWIRSRLRNLRGGGIYGPWAFGTAAYSVLSDWPGGGVIGVHGTNQPGLIPGRPSHGCIRVPNDRIRKLVRRMPIGTPVEIL